MNRDLYSAVRHAQLDFLSPLPGAAYATLLREVLARPMGIALDVGCGKGTLLAVLAERGWSAQGLERSVLMAAAARDLAAQRGLADRITITEGDARSHIDSMGSAAVDFAACVGSVHAVGSRTEALAQMRRLVRPGGHVLLGDLYWRSQPAPELLRALEMPADALGDLAGLFASGALAGLQPLGCLSATPAEFHAYELAQYREGIAWHDRNSSMPEAGAILEQTERWWRLYESHTRHAFGFAACLYQVPGP